MKFKWKDETNIGFYECYLLDDDNNELQQIYFWDYSCTYQVESAVEHKWKRPYAYVVGYCNGYSMEKGFDKTEDTTKYGYNGTPEHTITDIKKWCENYIASMYIKHYINLLMSLESARNNAHWFIDNGYKVIKEN